MRRWLLLLLWFGLGLIVAIPVQAAEHQYCILWSRDVAELEVRSGSELTLIFDGDDLVYSQKDDVDIATATAKLIELRTEGHYRTCMALVEYDDLPLPDLPMAQTVNWANTVSLYAVGRQGVEPASADPTPNPGSDKWRAACEASYRTWDAESATVVRKGSEERVRCPLKLVEGEWIVPE